MAFKDFFFEKPEGEKTETEIVVKEEPQESKGKFPTSFPSSVSEPNKVGSMFPPTQPVATMVAITPENPACVPHMDTIMKLYEDGFDRLNMEGYDFYEFFKAVVKVGTSNPAMYGMALTMAQGMDSKVTKSSLISQSEYYISEINKVYQSYVENGNLKREQALKAKGNEEASLSQELSDINGEILRLTQLQSQKQSELSQIESKYSPEITDIQCKLMANDMAKDKIIGSIKTVVDGINQNI